MTISWGILGAGKIAERQMAPAMALAPGHELLAVMRRDRDAARHFANRHGALRAYDRVDALLADRQIDAVYVATPPHLHAQHTILAAEAGKHVLCEKPMALTTADARRMIESCRANDVALMICYYQRFNSRHQRIKELIEAGAIGRVTAARINFSERFPPQPGVWHHQAQISGGGPLMDLAVHCLDLLRFFCGPIRTVSAFVDTLADPSPVEDTATLLLRMHNGAHAVCTTHWSTANFDAQTSNSVSLYGSEGTIVAAPIQSKDSSGTLTVTTAAGTQDLSVSDGGVRPHVALLQAFGQALTAGSPLPLPGEEGLAGLAVVEAAYASARSGRHVDLEGV